MKFSTLTISLALASLGFGFLPPKPGAQTEQQILPHRLVGDSFGIPSKNATYDFVIAGAGLAGSVVAARLAEAFPNMTIAVVEPGSFFETTNGNYSQIPYYSFKWVSADVDDWQPLVDWGLITEPEKGLNGRRVHYAQGKGLGGSSGRNQMIYHRGTNGSYQAWADHVGDSSYTFANMLPFFKKTFSFTGPNPLNMPANQSANYSLSAYDYPGGDVHVSFPNFVQPISSYGVQAFSSAGYPPSQDFASGSLLGYGRMFFTIDPTTGTRSSADQLLAGAIERSNALKIYPQTEGRNIIFDENNRATGLNVTSMGRKPFTLTARKEVIVSAGVWHSPQLLMVSGVGPASTLQAHNITVRSALPGVGQNIWDTCNVGGPIYEVNIPTAGPITTVPSLMAAAAEQYYHNGTGPFSSEGADFWGWEKIPQNLRGNWTNATRAHFDSFPADWPEVETILSGSAGSPAPETSTQNLITIGNSMIATASRGNMTIRSADMMDAPVIATNWLLEKPDQEMAVAAYRRARDIGRGLGDVVLREMAPGTNVTTDEQILKYVREKGLKAIHHGSSSCAMGRVEDKDKGAVVDSKARVIGVQGLRVIDSSSFPFTPPGHTQGTTYAHAEKLVQDVINEYM